MFKLLNKNSFLLILLIAVSWGASGLSGCDSGSGGGGKKTKIDGIVLEVIDGPVSDIKVSVFENNKRRASTRTNQFGEFNLKFKPNFNTVRLEFEGADYTLSRNISVTRDSEVVLDVIIQISPASITFTNWTVFQKRMRANDFDEIIFNSTEADFNIDGKGSDCIRAKGDSRVEITARTISLINCTEGISAASFGLVILEADEDISLIAKKDGIRSRDNTFVRVSMTSSPVDNNIFITSLKENGIRSSGSSQVIVDPQNDCTITGAKNPISQSGTSTVDPDGCTLAEG